MKWCIYCHRWVKARKRFSWVVFLLFCLTGIGGMFYLFYFWFFKKKECPICGGNHFMDHEPQPQQHQQTEHFYDNAG